MDDNEIYMDQLRHLVLAGHLRGALELLNIQSGFRFTAIYRLGETHAENFILVDRDNEPATPFTADIPLDETYCHMVECLSALVIEDASNDQRLSTHKYRDVVRSYCSVPLLEGDGSIYGTLCQFDTEPRASCQETLHLMQELGSLLQSEAISTSYRRADIDQRVDRLSDMKALISDASLDASSARANFDIYAAPLLAEAQQRLPMHEALEIEARISAIWHTLLLSRQPVLD